MSAESLPLNLDFRPRSYFWPLNIETHLRATVRGAERRAALEQYIASGRLDEAPVLVIRDVLTAEERTALGRIHPDLMGGEYLAARSKTEVEIARITIASVTSDVTSVYAKASGSRIRYRVVDEYEGDTLGSRSTRTSIQPLTLRELGRFFLTAWSLVDVIAMNFGDGAYVRALRFARGDSAYYHDFARYIAHTVEKWVEERASDPSHGEVE